MKRINKQHGIAGVSSWALAVIASGLLAAVTLVQASSLLAIPGVIPAMFAPGDVFVAMRTGQVQWRHPDGMLQTVLIGSIPGKVEGLGFDVAGNLYVSHYCGDASDCFTGNSFEKFDASGMSQGAFGSGYNCNPYSITFNAAGDAYIGQADCTGAALEFDPSGTPLATYKPNAENRGTAWVDLASDGCTLFYTSQGSWVKRYDVCSDMQLADFNVVPLATIANQFHILPDGGVLVATNSAIIRLDASGQVIQSYTVPGEPSLWYGVALVGDGTFWASNYGSSDVVRFDLASGAVLSSFNTGTPTTTVKGLAVLQ
jgi:hypothetical protein